MITYECLQVLAPKITDELVITNLGGVAREWQYLKEREGNLYSPYLGQATSLALGLALAVPNRRVISLDGDGSILLDLTVLPVIAQQAPSNLIVIIFDNQAYEAVGSIPTFTAGKTNLAEIARGAGIQNVSLVKELSEFEKAIDDAFKAKGATFIVVKAELGHLPGTWLALDGTENKYRFIRYIEKTEKIQIIKPAKKKIWATDEV